MEDDVKTETYSDFLARECLERGMDIAVVGSATDERRERFLEERGVNPLEEYHIGGWHKEQIMAAAAPDLYDALEAILSWGLSLGDIQQVHEYEELRSKAKAALAKARGEA